MRCPKCNKEGCRYTINRTDVLRRKKQAVRKNKSLRKKKRSRTFGGQYSKKNVESRIDFRAKCKKCGWSGIIE